MPEPEEDPVIDPWIGGCLIVAATVTSFLALILRFII